MMNTSYLKHLSAGVLGGMLGCFLVALIIGGIYGLITNKNHPKEEFSRRNRKAISVVYWCYLPVYYIFIYKSAYEPQGYRIALLFYSIIASLMVWGLYRCIRAIIGGKRVGKKGATNQTDTINRTKQSVNLVEGENKVILEHHSSNLTESEEYWGLISFAYGKIKQTSIFELWRREQFDCQFGKCAICGKPMEIRFAQVDHIKPRYKKGTNYSNNLALVHKDCNMKKGAKIGFEKPTWMKDNKYSEKLDEKVYEITKEIRADYPTKFPDELFTKPVSKA